MDWQTITLGVVGGVSFLLTLRYFWRIFRHKESPCSGCSKRCPHQGPDHCNEGADRHHEASKG